MSSKKYVLIENDPLIRKSWEFEAKNKSIDLDTFASVAAFLQNSQHYPLDTLFYIDSDLDDGVLGEIEAQKIFELGFKQLHLASGKHFRPEDIPPYILKAGSKKTPF